MKWFVAAALSGLVLSTSYNAYAVKTKACPETLSVTYDKIQALDDNRLAEEAEYAHNTYFLDELKAIRDLVAKLDSVELKLTLVKRANSKCSYESDQAKGVETRLYTVSGNDLLRVAIKVGKGEEVWAYHRVNQYSEDGIEVKHIKAVRLLGLFDHGAPRTTVGWAVTPAIK